MRRKDSSFIAFRKRVPADIVGKADGRSVVIRFPAEGSDPQHIVFATVGNAEVKFSLPTRVPPLPKAAQGLPKRTYSGSTPVYDKVPGNSPAAK